MPRLWVMSDLHLEAVPHPEAFRPTRPAFDVLVAAGDVWEGSSARALAIVAELAGGKPAVFVLGNHEPWHRDLAEERAAACRAAERHGITLLDDDEAECAGVRFVGGTLWADGELAGKERAPRRATGEQIYVDRSRGARWITNGDEAVLHRETRDVIASALTRARDDRPVVVVTHHAPHPCCLPPATRTGWVAGNSASDLSYLTDAGLAELWVHGHVHNSIDLVRPGGTRIVCNPAGPRFSNPNFQDDLVVEV